MELVSRAMAQMTINQCDAVVVVVVPTRKKMMKIVWLVSDTIIISSGHESWFCQEMTG